LNQSGARLKTMLSGARHGLAVHISLFLVQCVEGVCTSVEVCCNVLQCVVVCCNVLQCVVVCCNVLQCVAV